MIAKFFFSCQHFWTSPLLWEPILCRSTSICSATNSWFQRNTSLSPAAQPRYNTTLPCPILLHPLLIERRRPWGMGQDRWKIASHLVFGNWGWRLSWFVSMQHAFCLPPPAHGTIPGVSTRYYSTMYLYHVLLHFLLCATGVHCTGVRVHCTLQDY